MNWDVAPQPDGSAGAFVRNPLDAWGIWTGSQNRAAAWKFVEFLSQDESLVELTKAGLSVSKEAVMKSDAFLKQEPVDVNWKLFADALNQHTKQHPDTAIFSEMSDLLETEWGAVLDGASTSNRWSRRSKGRSMTCLPPVSPREIAKVPPSSRLDGTRVSKRHAFRTT